MRSTRSLLRVAQLWRPLAVAVVAVGVLAPGTAASADPSIPQIQQQIESKSNSLEKVVEQFNKVNEDLKASQKQAAAITEKIKPLQAQLASAQDEVSSIAVRAFKGGNIAALSSLLASGSPSVLVDKITTMDQIARSDQRNIKQFTATKTRHDAEAARLAKLIAEQSSQRSDLSARRTKINSELNSLFALRRQAFGRAQAAASRTSGSSKAVPPYVAGRAGVAVRFAYGALGTPYVWAADGPGGYDCSGLTMAAWRAAGVSLPHNAAEQYYNLPHLARSQLSPGDLVFYSGLGHVAIYVGGGRIIHAPTFGEVVKIASVDMMTPYGYARPG